MPLSEGERGKEKAIEEAVCVLLLLAWEQEPNDKRAQASKWISSRPDGNERAFNKRNEMRQRGGKKLWWIRQTWWQQQRQEEAKMGSWSGGGFILVVKKKSLDAQSAHSLTGSVEQYNKKTVYDKQYSFVLSAIWMSQILKAGHERSVVSDNWIWRRLDQKQCANHPNNLT